MDKDFILPEGKKYKMLYKTLTLIGWKCLFYLYYYEQKGISISRKDLIKKYGTHAQSSSMISKLVNTFIKMGYVTISHPKKEKNKHSPSYIIQLTPLGKKIAANIYDIVKCIYSIDMNTINNSKSEFKQSIITKVETNEP